MLNIYRVTIDYSIDEDKSAELHFSTQKQAEKYIRVMKEMLTEKGKNIVSFDTTIIQVFQEDEEVGNEMLNAVKVVSLLNDTDTDLKGFMN